MKHHDQHFEGEHEAIIDAELFAAVQALLAGQTARRKGSLSNEADIHRLAGIVFDETGDRLSPAYVTNHGKRYRYYVSARLKNSQSDGDGGWRIPAQELEAAVEHQFRDLFTDQSRLSEWVQLFASTTHIIPVLGAASKYAALAQPPGQKAMLRSIFERITVSDAAISFQVDRKALVAMLCAGALPDQAVGDALGDGDADVASTPFMINLPIAIKRRGMEKRIVIDNHVQARLPDPTLVDLIARANLYLTKLTDGAGDSITDLANDCCVHAADISRILPLAFLSPKIVDAILTGTQPADLTARTLSRTLDLPHAWHKQESALRS